MIYIVYKDRLNYSAATKYLYSYNIDVIQDSDHRLVAISVITSALTALTALTVLTTQVGRICNNVYVLVNVPVPDSPWNNIYIYVCVFHKYVILRWFS